jgi:type VI secretion system secreted protein Hcp
VADYFLKVDGIPGESADAKHKDEIDVLAFSWGLSQTGTAATGCGGASGRAVFDDLIVVARASKASPQLWLACANGTHLKSAVLTCRRRGEAAVEFLTIQLTDVVIASDEVDGSEEEEPVDQISLSYGRIETKYAPADQTGKLQSPIGTGWDVKVGKEA